MLSLACAPCTAAVHELLLLSLAFLPAPRDYVQIAIGIARAALYPVQHIICGHP